MLQLRQVEMALGEEMGDNGTGMGGGADKRRRHRQLVTTSNGSGGDKSGLGLGRKPRASALT